MSKKDDLRQAMNNLAHNDSKGFTPIKPMSLDDLPNRTATADSNTDTQAPKVEKTQETSGTANGERKNLMIQVKGRHKEKVTKRYSFECTLDMLDQLKALKDDGVNVSEFIRRAIAKELNRNKKG